MTIRLAPPRHLRRLQRGVPVLFLFVTVLLVVCVVWQFSHLLNAATVSFSDATYPIYKSTTPKLPIPELALVQSYVLPNQSRSQSQGRSQSQSRSHTIDATETVSQLQLQIVQQRLNLTDGHNIMARIQTVVDGGTEALRFENAVLQQENDSFEHMVNRTEWQGKFLVDRGTTQLVSHFIYYPPKEDDAVVLRPSPVHKETLRQLQILQGGLNLTDGHMDWIRNVVDEETEALRLENAELKRENEAFGHMVQRKQWRDRRIKSLDHFFMHIPKTGGVYARDTLPDLLQKSPQWKRLRPYNRYKLCGVGLRPLARFPSFPNHQRNVRCTMWMTEQPYSDIPQHTYAILRSPRSHVLSQYFHCAESIHRSDKAIMPSLDSWLDAWVDGLDNQTKREQNGRFDCPYNPISYQSTFVLFDESSQKRSFANATISLATMPKCKSPCA
jgi:hypothetical protein